MSISTLLQKTVLQGLMKLKLINGGSFDFLVVLAWLILGGLAMAVIVHLILKQESEAERKERDLAAEEDRRIVEAEEQYRLSLLRLEKDPRNPECHIQTLEYGRFYYGLLRGDGKPTLFDETAIRNEINAVSVFGGNSSSESNSQSKKRECPFCAELILAKAKICKHCQSKVPPSEIVGEAEKLE